MIAELALRQHNIVARWQLLEAGLTERAIQRRLESGHLHLVFRGVYAVGTPNVTQDGRWMASVLAVRGLRGLGHRSAAALWNLTAIPNAPIEVVTNGSSRRRAGLIVHRSPFLTEPDLTSRRGIPVTSVARTLVDLATRVSDHQLREAFYRAEALRRLDRPALLRCLTNAGRRRGSGTLRHLLDDAKLPLADANRGLERRFLRFCQSRGLPIPEVNAPLGDCEVDCLWRKERLVVELDSWEFHRDRESFESDRSRDTWFQGIGHRIVRVTDRRMNREGDELEAELRAFLGLGPQL